MSDQGTIASIARLLAETLRPLGIALANQDTFAGFMRTLGWDAPSHIASIKGLEGFIKAVEGIADSEELSAADVVRLIGELRGFFNAVKALSSGGGQLPSTIDAAVFRAEFPAQLRDYLIYELLIHGRPKVGRLMEAVGVVRTRAVAAQGRRPAYVHREIVWSALPGMFGQPSSVFSTGFGWGQSSFEATRFLEVLFWLGDAFGFAVDIGSLTAAERSYLSRNKLPQSQEPSSVVRWELLSSALAAQPVFVGLGIAPLPETASDKPGIAILPYVQGSQETSYPLSQFTSLSLTTSAGFAGGLALSLRPGKSPVLEQGILAGTPAAAAELGIELNSSANEPVVIVGDKASSRLEARSLVLSAGAKVRSGNTPAAYAELRMDGAALVITTGSADGFLATVLGGEKKIEFGFTLGLDSQNGVYFSGSSGLEIQIPTHLSLGPVEIRSVKLAVKPQGETLPVDLTATFGVDLAAIQAVVEDIGISAVFKKQDDGNLGPLNVGLEFRPPTGIGVVVDAGPVKGGGYLFFDKEKAEYGGALELTINEVISVSAIGLLNTRMPGSQAKTFSLLVIMSAEFGTPLPIGMGFNIVAVGGCVGIHRALRQDLLVQGVRTGAVNSVLFPKDIVANAPKIFDDLRTIFVQEQGAMLAGPFFKIGWGTPPLVTLALGIIVEIPGDIIILGKLEAILPEKVPVLVLQVSFVGALEHNRRRLYFFAVLFDSRVQQLPLDGEMGVLTVYGDNPSFLVSAGGFHPDFDPPPLPFPTPKRISIEILNRSNARISADGYFALSSNAIMFGFGADLMFGFSACRIEGDMHADCLIRYSPFSFEISLSASLSARVFNVGCFGISLRLALEGPRPWHAHGTGKIAISAAPDVSVSFDKTWGSDGGNSLPSVAIFPQISAEFDRPQNWRTILPAGSPPLVTLRELATTEAATIFVHPVGLLEVAQRNVPLDLSLDKVGNQKPSDVDRFTLSVTGGAFVSVKAATEKFAPAQFENLSDSQKLSRASYESMHAGLTLGPSGPELTTARAVKRKVRFEEIVLDSNYKRSARRFVSFPGKLFHQLAKNGSIGRSVLSNLQKTRVKGTGQRITLTSDKFTVAFQQDNKPVAQDASVFSSEASAWEYMRSRVASDPSLKDRLHVIPVHEKAAA